MKTVTNKTNAPIRVPLPRGKSLRLGPRKEGQIRDEAAEHPAVKKLVADGRIEIFDGGERPAGASGGSPGTHTSTQGHAKSVSRERQGDR